MKKIIISLAILIGSLTGTSVMALEPGITMGVSANAGMLSATGKESLRNGGGTLSSQGVVSKSEDMFIGYGTVFAEAYLNPMIRVGLDYAPGDLE